VDRMAARDQMVVTQVAETSPLASQRVASHRGAVNRLAEANLAQDIQEQEATPDREVEAKVARPARGAEAQADQAALPGAEEPQRETVTAEGSRRGAHPSRLSGQARGHRHLPLHTEEEERPKTLTRRKGDPLGITRCLVSSWG